MYRMLCFVLLLFFGFLIGAYGGVHCPVINHFAGGTGPVAFGPVQPATVHAPAVCERPCCCDCTKCDCCKTGKCTCGDDCDCTRCDCGKTGVCNCCKHDECSCCKHDGCSCSKKGRKKK